MRKNSQKTGIPQLHTGEQLILKSQGAYKDSLRSGWKIAGFYLTNQRLMICRGRTVRFKILVNDIKALKLEKLHYVLRRKQAVCLFYKAGKGPGDSRLWFVVNDCATWQKRIIMQASLLKIDLETIEKISARLDPDGQDILWHLWNNRHARIDRLAELIDAPDHMHVLIKIRETINPISEKVVGCPILSFERARTDPGTGEKVLFSWWLMGAQEKWKKIEEPLLDIFDEGSFLQIIMEIKGEEASDLRLDVHKNELVVRSEKTGSALTEIIRLPCETNFDSHQVHLRNNLLEIKLLKTED